LSWPITVGKVRCAVDGIDCPEIFATNDLATFLFAKNVMVGEEGAQLGADVLLDHSVDFGHGMAQILAVGVVDLVGHFEGRACGPDDRGPRPTRQIGGDAFQPRRVHPARHRDP
jgi:hypothetical protein